LAVKRGETVALVGPSGGGKTTLLNLIPRFYDATAGRVTIDGHDVREVTLKSLRHQIALVTQEPFLFDDSIRANIAYAHPDASTEQIERAAKEAAAHEFILSLPDGATSALDTESEAQVQAALKRLMAGRATILIAHRLSTVRGADRIYVID